jgi:hypothetical protein
MRIPALTLALLAATAGSSSAVEFHFAPADGLECDQRLSSTKTTTVQGHEDSRRVESGESVTHLRYEKVADGYKVRSHVQSAAVKRDGKTLEEPFTKAIIGRELVMDLGPNGELIRVEGYDKLIADMLAALPEDAREAAAKVMTTASLEERDRAEWNGRISEFVGKKAKEGETWDGESEFPMPSGPVKLKSTTRFAKIDESSGKPLVTIDFAFAADGPDVKAVVERTLKDVSSLTKGFEPKIGEATAQGGGQRVIDASTMTISRETVTRNISMPMDVPQVGKAVIVRTETREYTTDCK